MTQTRTTKENLNIFHTIVNKFGNEENCHVETYWDEKKENYIDILVCKDSPCKSVCSYSTIALSDFSIGKKVNGVKLGVEIIGACEEKFAQFPNVISTCAFNIIIEKASCFPGAIYPNVVEMYLPQSTMKHILFVPPFGWNNEFETLVYSSKIVAWLLIVPISDPEYHYAMDNGSDMLISLFAEKQIDIFDLNRISIL